MTKHEKLDQAIAKNRKAMHDYFIEDRLEVGLSLLGWEVKSCRMGKVQLDQAYVILKRGEAWLLGATINPLQTTASYLHPDPQRTRKLLLHTNELNKWIGQVERKGYTLVPLLLYWKKNRVKLAVGLAKGKKQHDKRRAIKERDWQREKQRVLKKGSSRNVK